MTSPASTWISVKDAALLVRRHQDTVYTWIDDGRITARRNARGVLEVEATSALAAESTVRIGRPRNTARPNITTTRRIDVLDKTSERREDVFRQSRSTPEGQST